MAAHDLRNPVNLVLNYADLLDSDTHPILAPEHRVYVDTIGRTATRMARLIDSFLDVSLIDSGRFELERTVISIPRLLQSARQAVEPTALNRLTCRLEGPDLFFSVTDVGSGMEAETREHLFRAFESPQERRPDGSRSIGLGLLIAQKIVTAHGGRMVIESEPGVGSMFGFTVPAEVPVDAKAGTL